MTKSQYCRAYARQVGPPDLPQPSQDTTDRVGLIIGDPTNEQAMI